MSQQFSSEDERKERQMTTESMLSPSLTDIPVTKTEIAGNWDSGKWKYDLLASPPIQVKSLRLTWNGAVVKGLSIEFFGATDTINIGDWTSPSLDFAKLELKESDVLQEASIFTRPYGYGTVYGMKLVTRSYPNGWVAGNVNGTPTVLNVRDHAFMGVAASVNEDYFLNAIAFYINRVDTKQRVS
jgi:hypothetical protein